MKQLIDFLNTNVAWASPLGEKNPEYIHLI